MQASAEPHLGTVSRHWQSHSTTLSSLRLGGASRTPSRHCIAIVALSQHPIWALHLNSGAIRAPHCHLYGMEASAEPHLGTVSTQWHSHSTTLSSPRPGGARSTPSRHCIVTVALLRHPIWALHLNNGSVGVPHSHFYRMEESAQPHVGTVSTQWHSHSTALSSLRP